MSKLGESKTSSKRIHQTVVRFNYFQKIIQQEGKSFEIKQPILNKIKHTTSLIGKHHYHFIRQTRDPIQNQQLLQKGSLLENIQQTFIQSGITKLNDASYSKSINNLTSSFGDSLNTHETVQCYIVDQDSTMNMGSKLSNKSYSSKYNSQVKDGCKVISNKYAIYVVHGVRDVPGHCSYFVQRIRLGVVGQNGKDEQLFEYHAIFSFPQQNTMWQNVMKLIKPSKRQLFIQHFIKNSEIKLNMFESVLSKQLHHIHKQQQNQQKHCHPEFKRQNNLPPGQFKKYTKVKQQTYHYFNSINKNRKPNHYVLDNLVCRFLRVKNYDEVSSIKAIHYYLDWEKRIRTSYTYQSFNHYHKMDIYDFIGKDFKGRPILYYYPDRVIVDNITNTEEFLDFNCYMLEMFTQDHSEGYIDEFILIADFDRFSTKNFKFDIAKGTADYSDKLFPDRQFKLVCFGLGTFCNMIYKMVKPLIPKYAADKVSILGTDKTQLKQCLESFMSIDLLPKYVFAIEPVELSQKSSISTGQDVLKKTKGFSYTPHNY